MEYSKAREFPGFAFLTLWVLLKVIILSLTLAKNEKNLNEA